MPPGTATLKTSPPKAPEIGVGLLGLGVVGGAVANALIAREAEEADSPPIRLRGVVVRSVKKKRGLALPAGVLSADPGAVLSDPSVQIVVEVMGGERPAFDYISRALNSGKHVVTANKEVLCKRGNELLPLAARNGVRLYYEASVGGGIPILGPLSNDLNANRILSLRAIINGTTNYILTKMAAGGSGYDQALKEAQTLGYAEADPTADVDAHDASYKISILARLAFKSTVPLGAAYREGIRNVGAKDFRYARDLGFTIKLMAAAQRQGDGLVVRVHPAFVPISVPMAGVNGVMNAVEIEGDMVGPLWFQGRGAGPKPTASAVMGDVLRIARETGGGRVPAISGRPTKGPGVIPMGRHECQYYMRMSALDRAGVLAKIAGALGAAGISIRSVLQMDTDEERGVADLVIMTHMAVEAKMQKAVAKIRGLDVIASFDNLIRVENYPGVS